MSAARRLAELEPRGDMARRLLALASDAALVLEAGRVAFANDAALRALGSVTFDELEGRTLAELVEPAEDGPVVPRARDGAAKLELSTYRVALGDVDATLAILRDGAPRTPAERARIESELRLRESQRLAQIGSWELDLVTDRLVWSDEIFRIFELDPGGFGASYESFLGAVHPDDREQVDEAYKRSVAERTPYEIVHRLRMADGRVKVVQERGRTFFDAGGAPLRSIGTVQDITARVRLEEQLRLRDEAIAGSAAGIVFADLEGRLTSVNDAFVRLWRFDDARQVIGRAATDFWASPAEAAAALATVQQSGSAVGELLARCHDGATFIAQFVATIARRADGSPIGLMAQFFDVTARVEAERALAAREEELRQSQKLEAVGRLAGGVAHDFNNLLTVVLSVGSILAEQVEDRPESRELVEDILGAGERAAELTRQLLAFARLGRSAPRVIELNERVREFARVMARLIGEDVELRLELASEPLAVKLDPTQLEQILLNLSANARDAMPSGGALVVRTWLDSSDARPGVRLSVRDTGDGMSDEVRARVFEPFFTTKQAGRGTGLGLATVHGIVRQAGGEVSVESSPMAGTTFLLSLPLADAPTERAEVTRSTPPAGAGERILLVEDDPAVRALTRRILSDAGYLVVEAENARAALAHLGTAARIDLVLSDVVMPGLSGAAVGREFARLRPMLPVLFMSGYAAESPALEGLGRILRKPFRPDALLVAVRRVIDERAPA